MGSLTQDYIDLIASGDKQKIGCVLLAAGSAAGVSGLAAGTVFAPANVVPVAGQAFNATAAGIGAVLGALLAAKKAYNTCGGAATRGSFEQIFEAGKVSDDTVSSYQGSLRKEFNVSESEAKLLAKAALVYSSQNALAKTPDASPTERKNAVAFLLQKLSQEGVVG
jgi:hypothetical protein